MSIEGIFWNNNNPKGHLWCLSLGFNKAMRKDFHTEFGGSDIDCFFIGDDPAKGYVEYVKVPGELLR